MSFMNRVLFQCEHSTKLQRIFSFVSYLLNKGNVNRPLQLLNGQFRISPFWENVKNENQFGILVFISDKNWGCNYSSCTPSSSDLGISQTRSQELNKGSQKIEFLLVKHCSLIPIYSCSCRLVNYYVILKETFNQTLLVHKCTFCR